MVGLAERGRCVLGLYRLLIDVDRASFLSIVFYGLALPVGLLWWASSYEDATRIRSILGAAVLSALFIALRRGGQTVAIEKLTGAWRLLEGTRVTRGTYLAAHALDTFLLAMVPVLLLPPATVLLLGLEPGSLLWLLPYGLAVVSFGAFGFLIGGVCRSLPVAGLATNLSLILALTLCPLLYPRENVPDVLRAFVLAAPPTLAVDAMTSAWEHGLLPRPQLAGLAAWAVGATVALVRWFPWTDRDQPQSAGFTSRRRSASPRPSPAD